MYKIVLTLKNWNRIAPEIIAMSMSYEQKVWKFGNFSAAQILREINFSESAALTDLAPLKFAFRKFLHFI